MNVGACNMVGVGDWAKNPLAKNETVNVYKNMFGSPTMRVHASFLSRKNEVALVQPV